MVQVYLKDGRVLTFNDADKIKDNEKGFIIVQNNEKNYGKFVKENIFGAVWFEPNIVETPINDEIKRLNTIIQQKDNYIKDLNTTIENLQNEIRKLERDISFNE